MGRIYRGQDNLSNQKLDCTTFTCSSLLWLMPLHIVTLKLQPSLTKSRLVCVLFVSVWLTTDFRESRLHVMVHVMLHLRSYSLDLHFCCGKLYVKANGEDSDCIWTLTIQTYPNSLLPLSWWSELLIQILLPKFPRKYLEFKVRDLVYMKTMKGIMCQWQATVKTEKISQF